MSGWTLEEIEQGYPEGSNGFGHHADFNDVIFSMFGYALVPSEVIGGFIGSYSSVHICVQ